MKTFPAVDLRANDAPGADGPRATFDLLYAVLDDFQPTAVEERDAILRAFFASADARDRALAALSPRFEASAVDVPDDDWARRSQENLSPVSVGRITIVTRHHASTLAHRAPGVSSELGGTAHAVPSTQPASSERRGDAIAIVIEPSMGFGTGHHATTRLCLAALQHVDVAGKRIVDVGTGSGILAIAASRLGAADAIGIDVDADAIHAARENLALNPAATVVSFAVAELGSAALPPADIVTANLTGALLARSAAKLLEMTRADGILILSGVLETERDAVVRAFAGTAVVWERHEEEWVGLAMKKS